MRNKINIKNLTKRKKGVQLISRESSDAVEANCFRKFEMALNSPL